MLMRNDSTERFKKSLWTSIMNYLRPILMHLTASSWIGSSGTIPSVCITHSTINCPQRNICYHIINNRRDKLLPSPEYGAVIHGIDLFLALDYNFSDTLKIYGRIKWNEFIKFGLN